MPHGNDFLDDALAHESEGGYLSLSCSVKLYPAATEPETVYADLGCPHCGETQLDQLDANAQRDHIQCRSCGEEYVLGPQD